MMVSQTWEIGRPVLKMKDLRELVAATHHVPDDTLVVVRHEDAFTSLSVTIDEMTEP